jgi:hypothetical protein
VLIGTVAEQAANLAHLTKMFCPDCDPRIPVGWWIGDWWNAGERFGNRVAIVKAPD